MRYFVALFVLISAAGLLPFAAAQLNEWSVGSAYDFSVRLTNPLKVGDGRMGIFFNSLQAGPASVQVADLEALAPARLAEPDLIDLGACVDLLFYTLVVIRRFSERFAYVLIPDPALCSSEMAVSGVKSAANPNIVYFAIALGSQGIVRKYNATYTIVNRNETQQNTTEIRNPDGSINSTIVTGNITTYYVDFIPRILRTAAPHSVRPYSTR